MKPQRLHNWQSGGLNGKTRDSKGVTWHTASYTHPQKWDHFRITWSNYEPLHSWTDNVPPLGLIAHSKETQSWDKHQLYCKKWEHILISDLLEQSIVHPTWSQWLHSVDIKMTVHRRKVRKYIWQTHEECAPDLCRAHKAPLQNIPPNAKPSPQPLKMPTASSVSGKWQVTFTSVTPLCQRTPHELPPSSQKTKLKGKCSFSPVCGLCTEIEICPLSSCSVDQAESLHPCSPKSRVILYILLRPTVHTGLSFHNRIDSTALHWAESSKHPFMTRYPKSKPRHHQGLMFCFSFTNLEIISICTCLPWTQN